MQPPPEFNPYAPPAADVDQGLHLGDDLVLADRGARFLAFLIDVFLMFFAMLPGIGILFVVVDGAGPSSLGIFGRADGILSALLLAFVFLLAFQGFQWYLISTTGQSLGKRWLGVKIVRMDGLPCGFVHGVLLRSWVPHLLVSFVPFLGYVFFLVDALFILGDERRCIHDHMASTQVVVAPKA